MYMSQRPITRYNFNAESGPMIYIAHEMTPFSPSDVTVYSNCDEVRLTVYKNGKVYTQKKQEIAGLPSLHFLFKDVYDFMDTKRLARAKKQDEYYMLAEGLIDGKVVARHKRYPAQRPERLRLRLDNNGTATVADGSDVVTVIAELIDKNGVVRRLNNFEVNFSIEGEGRLIGETTASLCWGTAPILVQSTLKPGKVRVIASMKYEGTVLPLSGELEFETIANPKQELYSENESKLLNISNSKTEAAVRNAASKSELEKENERLRQLLNEYRAKEVGEQQTKLGTGLND